MKHLIVKYCFLVSILFYFSLTVICQSTRMKKPELKSFINTHIEYPLSSLNNKEEGVVKILFTTNDKGVVIKREVITKVSDKIDSAAVSLFDLVLWNPAESYGLPVEGTSEFKIRYNISKYNQLVRQRGYDQIALRYIPIDYSGKIYTVKELNESPSAILDSIYPSVQHFVAANLIYPESAEKFSIEGVAKLRFVIEANGLPSNIVVIEPVGGGCTEEAIRVMQLIKWQPGVKNKKAVRTCYNLNIKFDSADELRNKHIPNQSNTGI